MSLPKTLLWLDDERDPADDRWRIHFPIEPDAVVWVKSYPEFIDWIDTNGLPAAVCFDHDLGECESGLDAAKWLTEHCLEHNVGLPAWSVQSANPIGRANIESLLGTFERIMGR